MEFEDSILNVSGYSAITNMAYKIVFIFWSDVWQTHFIIGDFPVYGCIFIKWNMCRKLKTQVAKYENISASLLHTSDADENIMKQVIFTNKLCCNMNITITIVKFQVQCMHSYTNGSMWANS
jgi:hypothetical protein